MSTSAVADEAVRFHADRPTDLRRVRPWHRLAYIVRVLPERLEALSPELGVPTAGRVLDYGCAEVPYRRFFDQTVEFVGADLPGNPNATVEISADGTLPVPDHSFDAVLSTQVLEHVADPRTYLRECARVLAPGGRLLLSTHGIMVYHPDPFDLWRWTGAGLRRIVEEAGFEVVRFEGIMGLAPTALQLLLDSVHHSLPRRVRPIVSFCFQALIALADRFESAERRAGNALVFALVAESRVPS
jgi:SAM-dependent methyltransferase